MVCTQKFNHLQYMGLECEEGRLRDSLDKSSHTIYTYYWQLRQTDPWLMGSSSLANGAIFFLANVIVVILANGIKSLG